MYREIFLLTVLLAVVGGMESRLGDYPSLVLIFDVSQGVSDFVCGGDLITNQHVASAAHCFRDGPDRDDIYLMAGSKNLLSPRKKRLYVEEIISHPGYKKTGKSNDYAILVLTEPIEENKYIKPVKLSKQRPAPGTKCTVTGWGFNEVEGVMKSQAFKEYVYVSTREQCHKLKGIDDASMFCAGVQKGAQEKGIDACKGDPGGPLFCNDELAGIVSEGKCRVLPEYPRVYADVSAQRDWFTRQIAKTSSSRKKGKNQSSVIISARVEVYFMLVLLILSYSNLLDMPFIYSNVNSYNTFKL